MKLQLIRSATLRLTYGGHSLLIDPYFAEKLSRPPYAGRSRNPLVDLPFPPDEIMSGIEIVLVSHLHSDHFDPAAQAMLPRHMPIMCQSEDESAIREIGVIHIHPVSDRYEWNGIHVQQIPGRHGSGDVLREMGISSGFLFEAAGEPSLYWAGDTVLCDEVRKAIVEKKPAVIVTHSCGAEWGDHVKIVMDEVETVEVCRMAPQSIVVATHMNAVDHATVSRSKLREYARMNGVSDQQLLIPADGETLIL